MSATVLRLRDFSVRIGSRHILNRVDLDLDHRQVLVILGPGGAGKSTLLRTICGLNDSHPALHLGGTAHYLGTPIDRAPTRPVLVEQRPAKMIATVFEYLATDFPGRSAYTRTDLEAHFAAALRELDLPDLVDRFDRSVLELTALERRLLMLASAIFAAPDLLCVDEPTTGLDEPQARRVLDLLAHQRRQRAILMVTHNQRHGRQISDHTALLAGGTIHEALPTDEFYSSPRTGLARSFIRTGSCTVASIDARPQELEPAYRPLAATRTAPPGAGLGPYGFHWMRPGQLAGTPMPGAVRPIEDDLDALRRVDVTLLVTLTLEPLDADLLARWGLEVCHFPIVDMQAPTPELAAEFCRTVDLRLQQGDVVAVHCLAGIGRTGTMLATYEIWKGCTAEQAFALARQVHPRWVQSLAQREFLTRFEQWLE